MSLMRMLGEPWPSITVFAQVADVHADEHGIGERVEPRNRIERVVRSIRRTPSSHSGPSHHAARCCTTAGPHAIATLGRRRTCRDVARNNALLP